MSELISVYSSYLPHLISVAAGAISSAGPWRQPFQAAILSADISGFTALAEKLAMRRPSGAEELTSHLNSCFSQLIEPSAAAARCPVFKPGDFR